MSGIVTSLQQDSPWKRQSGWHRTGTNGESTSMVWPTLGSRTAKEQNRTPSFLLSGNQDPRLTQCSRFLGPQKCSSQMGSRSVQSFMHSEAELSRVTDEQTDRQETLVAIICISHIRCCLKMTLSGIWYLNSDGTQMSLKIAVGKMHWI